MITEDYCSFEVAKLLKEKGFDEACRAVYEEEVLRINTLCDYYNSELSSYVCAPTHQMAMKWLREKGFHINAPISYDYSVDADGNIVDKWTFWTFEILSSFSGELIYTEEVNEYYSYEEAIEAALKYSLENLI